MGHTEHPTRKEVDRLLERVGPHLDRLFRRHGIRPETAEVLTDKALAGLIPLWDQIRDPEAWFLQRIEQTVQSFTNPLTDEPGQERSGRAR